MKLYSLFAVLIFNSCGSDISIMKRPAEASTDSSATEVDVSDTNEAHQETDEDTTVNDNPPGELTVGYFEYSLIQASCPPCFGIANEITTTKYARFHEPTGGKHHNWVPREDEFCRNYYESPVNANNIDVGNAVVFKSQSAESYLNKTIDGTGVVYNKIPYILTGST